MTTPSGLSMPVSVLQRGSKRTMRRARLGWWHTLMHGALLIGHPRSEEPGVLLEEVPAAMRQLALLVEEYRSHFAAMARTLGADYKGGYWMMYLIAPLAVVCAAVAVSRLASPRLLSGVELLLMVAILLLFLVMRRGAWQENWIRARRTAEHLRYLPLVAPFVGGCNGNWYEQMAAQHGLRIIVDPDVTRVCAELARTESARALHLENPVFNAGYLHYVSDVLGQQIRYHGQKAALERALSHRVGLVSTSLFAITIVCTALLFIGNLEGNIKATDYLRVLATIFPAIGAGLRGILAQGESHRVATLSEGMTVRLSQLREELEALPRVGASNRELENFIWNTVQELLSEADTWMRLQEAVPLSVAG